MDEFECIILSCGHSVGSYHGLGVCGGCKSKCCGRCLQTVGERLLCPRCFRGEFGGGDE